MPARRPLRPLVLISSLAPGGAERVTVSCLRRMMHEGRPVPLCTVTSRGDGPLARELEGARVTRHDLGARRLADPAALLNLVRLLRREQYDLVHAHGQDASILATAASAFHPAPLVITRHVVTESRDGWREQFRARATDSAVRRAAALIAVSNAAAHALCHSLGVAEERVRVIPNGVELERFATDDAVRWRTRKSLGLAAGDPMILVPAVLREGKGHDVILDALPRIRAGMPRARILMAGAGPLECSLRERARELGESVVFLGHRDDMPALMAAADLVVLASRNEALPTALIEAAAAGRAVVSTRVGGVEEVVVHGTTGILVPTGDPEAMAVAVIDLLLHEERARRLGDAARHRAVESFGIDAQVQRTWAVWEEVARRVAA